MPLKLIPPGKRGNKFWYVRGTINGQEVEASTGCLKKADAEKFAAQLTINHKPAEFRTFSYAASRYAAWRKPKARDLKLLDAVCTVIGNGDISALTQDDIVLVADTLHPHAKAATRNRCVCVPMAAVIHYAANNGWCRWLRVRKFKEPKPKTRYATHEHEAWLMFATRGCVQRRLLLLWLFRQGDRISDVLRVQYEDCDLDTMTVRRHISKTDSYRVQPLDGIIGRYLRRQRAKGASGRVFTEWANHHAVNRWIARLCSNLGIVFTPHMARHAVGKSLSDSGASLRTIMAKLGHVDVKSSIRYQAEDIETVRRASQIIAGKNSGKLR